MVKNPEVGFLVDSYKRVIRLDIGAGVHQIDLYMLTRLLNKHSDLHTK